MKLYEHFTKTGFHTSMVTTFGVDFDAYENIMLARFRGANCHNNILVSDSRMLSLALDGGSSLPRHAGRLYTVSGTQARGVFHPKIVLQIGRKGGRLIVGSANATAAGLAGNFEVAGIIECTADQSGERSLIARAVLFARRFLGAADPGIQHQLNWMLDRTPWLVDAGPAEDVVALADGTVAGFFTTGETLGIGRQLLSAVGNGEKIERMIVVSPYWDEDLSALRFLRDRTGEPECFILLDKGRHIFPNDQLKENEDIKLLDFKAPDDKRFVHAKAIILQTATKDHILYGSANCTVAALGNDTFAGTNEEACFYRALPRDAAITALSLEGVLKSVPLQRNELPLMPADESIPLADLALRHPGKFVCKFDTISWTPGNIAAPTTCVIELLGVDGEVLELALEPIPAERAGELRFRLPPSERCPPFARVKSEGGALSAPGVILVLDDLRKATRDARSRKIDVALDRLDGETEIGLFLLETLNEIEAAEIALQTNSAPTKRAQGTLLPKEKNDPVARTLKYEDFVAGRQSLSGTTAVSRNSLAKSELTHVRDFLNRVLGMGQSEPVEDGDDDSGPLDAFDLGDETSDAAVALEGGFEATNALASDVASDNMSAPEVERQNARRRRVTHDQLVEAVTDLQDFVATKAEESHLGTIDIFRLRAMLMIVAAAGRDGPEKDANSLQVLPSSGDPVGSWPRLLGRCLFAYFGGSDVAVRTLVIDDYYDQVPDDILECWASCMWAIQATLYTVERHADSRVLVPPLQKLAHTIYALVSLGPEQLLDARVMQTIAALNGRFAKSLGLDVEKIADGHRKSVGALLQLSTLPVSNLAPPLVEELAP